MRVLDGEQLLVRILLGESDKWHHTPLARVIHDTVKVEFLFRAR